jgi:hypothetical protein
VDHSPTAPTVRLVGDDPYAIHVRRMPFLAAAKEDNVMAVLNKGWNKPTELSRIVVM